MTVFRRKFLKTFSNKFGFPRTVRNELVVKNQDMEGCWEWPGSCCSDILAKYEHVITIYRFVKPAFRL